MDWFTVRTEADIEMLLTEFGEFHDGCLREVHIWTDNHVNDDLSMTCSFGLDTHMRMLFQRQFPDPSAVELLFEQVTAFHLAPSPENYDSIIFSAVLALREDGALYWVDRSGVAERDEDATWVTARALSWRPASEWMGGRLRYGPSAG